ncbi:NAD(P)-dependent oxidoreductase [Dactylosporangium sp. CA-233914]|uniref:NAD(P)-dependent oxidoreductase n=1 Tax=Dactylosporangium sp. CA-233914 TaxID=3239934 RepID=UPI003D8DF508
MVKIVVLGAAGTAGQRIVAEAGGRGHTVVPVVRDTAKHPAVAGVETVAGDATDPVSVTGLAAGADAVVIAIGSWTSAPWLAAAQAVVTAVAALPQPRPYVLHVGGGATLTTPDGTRFLDLPEFPAEFLPPARGQADALDYYREHASDAGVGWTYLSPPPVDFAVGERTGAYRTGDDQPVTDGEGRSWISYEDYAVAVVDEIGKREHDGRRFTVGY